MIEIRTELAEIIRFEQPLARRRLPAVHIRKAHSFQDHWITNSNDNVSIKYVFF